jgi:protein-L-isoaspartate(D-aspartate) O-methyltransferase
MDDPEDTSFSEQRHQMVQWQLHARGVTDERVLAAILSVPRHLFVPPSRRGAAYEDSPLPIGEGQTISQPYMVARMTELLALTGSSRVLEIGTGSGYQAAVLAEIAAEVWTVERFANLADRARKVLEDLGYGRVHVVVGDGTLGWPEEAPYDGIIVTAAAPAVPPAMTDQLAPGGRLVIPVGSREVQWLRVVTRTEEGLRHRDVLECRFVPLIGEQGYKE